MKIQSPVTLGLIVMMGICGFIGMATYASFGLEWRQSTNLPMTTQKIQAEMNKYWWSGSAEQNFQSKTPKIIIYGDSQAFDIFAALKNNPHIGVIYFPHSFKCSAFYTLNFGFDGTADFCHSFFNTLLNSKELTEAQYLIYTHEWEKLYEKPSNYSIAIEEIKKRNPKLKIIFFGPKPYLKGGTMNSILRNHSTFNINEYLNSIKRIDEANNQYARDLAKNLSVDFVDVNSLFCDTECPFFLNGTFTYFDGNHWTSEGGNLFYKKLLNNPEGRKFLMH